MDESDEEVTGDELRGFLGHEHDFSARWFGFGSLEAEHDGIEELALRAIPKLGAGYKFVNTGTLLLSADAGVAYVYQKYFGGDTESFMALAFGAEKAWKLPWLGVSWDTRLGWLAGDGVQFSISAGVCAQFDLGTASYELLNADYVIGLPITFRRGWFSTRVRLYHQISHLGDEYLLREPPDRQDRENLSFESLEWILSADAGALRLYGGGELLVNRNPEDLERLLAHGGVELRPSFRVLPLGGLGGFRLVAAADVKSSEEHDWKPATSIRPASSTIGPVPRMPVAGASSASSTRDRRRTGSSS